MLAPDFLDLISSFNAAEVRYLLIGGYAVGFHGRPRATKDLDVWVEASLENAPRIIDALRSFGAPLRDLSADDFAAPGKFYVMGRPPLRIDVVTTIDGVQFGAAWGRRVPLEVSPGVPCSLISLDDLIANKRAAARPQDLVDAAELEAIRALSRAE